MSHRATIELELRDPDALAEAARAVGARLDHGAVTFYDRSTISGLRIHLPGWRYPVVVDAQHRAHYDNYNGAWGDITLLHRFRQTYAVEATVRAARRLGRQVTVHRQPQGAVRLEIH
jgi:hypothetical protein